MSQGDDVDGHFGYAMDLSLRLVCTQWMSSSTAVHMHTIHLNKITIFMQHSVLHNQVMLPSTSLHPYVQLPSTLKHTDTTTFNNDKMPV